MCRKSYHPQAPTRLSRGTRCMLLGNYWIVIPSLTPGVEWRVSVHVVGTLDNGQGTMRNILCHSLRWKTPCFFRKARAPRGPFVHEGKTGAFRSSNSAESIFAAAPQNRFCEGAISRRARDVRNMARIRRLRTKQRTTSSQLHVCQHPVQKPDKKMSYKHMKLHHDAICCGHGGRTEGYLQDPPNDPRCVICLDTNFKKYINKGETHAAQWHT